MPMHPITNPSFSDRVVRLASAIPKRLLAFWALVFVYLGINLVYKLSGTSGKYSFSPSSALALAELIKMCMSLTMVYRSVGGGAANTAPLADGSTSVGGLALTRAGVVATFNEIKSHCSRKFLSEVMGLALLYCVNNNTYFWIYLYADAASIQLIKSGSSFISAFIMWVWLKRLLSENQWIAVTLQMCGLITVQWDPCKGSPVLHWTVYLALMFAVCVTSIASVWNEKVVKEKHPLNVINSVLYASGFVLQVIWFNLFSPADQGFFEGYGWLGVMVVMFNAFIGLAISAVYKYADVIVKLFSTTCVTGILMILNTFVFDFKPNVVIVAGTIVVFSGTYLYMKEPRGNGKDGDVDDKGKKKKDKGGTYVQVPGVDEQRREAGVELEERDD